VLVAAHWISLAAQLVSVDPGTAEPSPGARADGSAGGGPTGTIRADRIEPSEAGPLIQYGVAFTVEQVASAGPMCVEPCILTSGGGIAVRVGQRTSGPFYWGLAYELSKQGSSNIYRLGILQQLRAEGRYYLETGRVTQPFFQVGAGVSGYGNEWSIQTRGPMFSAGAGAQIQIARDTVLGIGLAYRALIMSGFTDSAGAARAGGIASLIGIDFQLEALDVWPFSSRK
jgi:hypothetical protein